VDNRKLSWRKPTAEEGACAAFGPVGDGEALRMASLTRSYDPVHLLDDSGARETRRLHPLWVAGLIDRAIADHYGRDQVIRVEIIHEYQGCIGETLRAHCADVRGTDVNGAERVEFVVVNERKDLVARALVEVVRDRG
jgi:hypothetical protein